MLANGFGLLRIDSIASAGGYDALPALPLELLVRESSRIALCQHLFQDTVSQPDGRVTKAGQAEALQQLGVDMRSGDNDLRAARADTGNESTLLIRHAGKARGKVTHDSGGSGDAVGGAGHGALGDVAALGHRAAGIGERGSGP